MNFHLKIRIFVFFSYIMSLFFFSFLMIAVLICWLVRLSNSMRQSYLSIHIFYYGRHRCFPYGVPNHKLRHPWLQSDATHQSVCKNDFHMVLPFGYYQLLIIPHSFHSLDPQIKLILKSATVTIRYGNRIVIKSSPQYLFTVVSFKVSSININFKHIYSARDRIASSVH